MDEFYDLLLREKLTRYHNELKNCQFSVGTFEISKIAQHAANLDSAIDELLSIIPSQRQATWLKNLSQSIKTWLQNLESSPDKPNEQKRTAKLLLALNAALNRVSNDYASLRPISLDACIDFDSVFEQIRDQHELEALFDRLVSAIQEIVACGAVDSVIIVNGLKSVLATLEKNKKGSYAGSKFSIIFSRNFLKHLGIEALKKAKGIDVLFKAYEACQSELEREFDNVEVKLVEATTAPLTENLDKILDVRVIPVEHQQQNALEITKP